MTFYKISTTLYLDKFTECYKTIVIINKSPDGPLKITLNRYLKINYLLLKGIIIVQINQVVIMYYIILMVIMSYFVLNKLLIYLIFSR